MYIIFILLITVLFKHLKLVFINATYIDISNNSVKKKKKLNRDAEVKSLNMDNPLQACLQCAEVTY